MKGPIFLRQPSPSLRKMQQMTAQELQEYLARLEEERARIATKLAARKKAGANTAHDQAAMRLEQRLAQLIDRGRRFWAAQRGI
jgi:hypothetical protein